jgi:DNA primase
MSDISPDDINAVRDAADIVAVIGAYSDLKPSRHQVAGLCPFHDESSPSFVVDAGEQIYHCCGCGAGGDVFGFVMEKEGLGFSETVVTLADRYGVDLHED